MKPKEKYNKINKNKQEKFRLPKQARPAAEEAKPAAVGKLLYEAM